MNEILYKKAIEFATKAHEGQMRKGTNIPYITHPIEVSNILRNKGYEMDAVISAVLHDTVEDTEVTLEEIEMNFGEKIAKIVDYVSEIKTKGYSWKERKIRYIERLDEKNVPHESLLVIGADKLHNLTTTYEDWLNIGDEVFNRFNARKNSQSWWYRSVANLLERKGLTDFSIKINLILNQMGL